MLNINGSAINLSGKPDLWCSPRTQSPVVERKRPSGFGCQAQRSEQSPQSKVAEGAWNISCGHKMVEGLYESVLLQTMHLVRTGVFTV